MTRVTFKDERQWVVGSLVNVVGSGSFHNGTNAKVDVSIISIPFVRGLDDSGATVWNNWTGEFDYVPPAGKPRPSSVTLAPGESIQYSFVSNDVSSSNLAKIRYWYSDVENQLVNFQDMNITVACGNPRIAVGESLPNTFRSSYQ